MSTPHEEIYIDPLHESRPAGWRSGEVLFAPMLRAAPRPDLEHAERTETALADVLTQMDKFLDAGGGTRGDVVRVTFFMRDVLDRPILNRVWEKWYPDAGDRPPHTYLLARHPDGVNVGIEVIALLGRQRTVLEVPGVQHQDPMSLGASVGELVASSRIFGSLDDLDDTISLLFERARILLSGADADFDALTQAVFFVGSDEIGQQVERRWQAEWPAGSEPPPMQVVVTDLGHGNGFPRIMILALTGS